MYQYYWVFNLAIFVCSGEISFADLHRTGLDPMVMEAGDRVF